MIFGISGTKRTVRNREVSVRRGLTVFKSRIFDSCMVQNQLQNVVDACLKPLLLSSRLHNMLVLKG